MNIQGVTSLGFDSVNVDGELTFTFVDLDALDEASTDLQNEPRFTNVVEDRSEIAVTLDYAEGV